MRFHYYGYTRRPDGYYEKVCRYPQGESERVEIMIRNKFGDLTRVIRGHEARRIADSRQKPEPPSQVLQSMRLTPDVVARYAQKRPRHKRKCPRDSKYGITTKDHAEYMRQWRKIKKEEA